ncbi:hypothetical protein HanRHA438_Chr17g0809481 [Helianthus annuus]|uniref:Uncharacterized protein n=1 Tax=Helianthus annuus TaxID=4232 RepID=A0A9K3GTY6_HELAN|nr:hypothetical protein HanXRQr2_Chr17g0799461 [Helianthus annuus]KAJ0812887.1 hypothetical protein HanPSC8_Chr17g0767051 [Helianthus annuus]KAJ0826013.1 hypothetical protein HanRHA438_Chr17g0809481 [Helianthus annuus]
MYDFRVTKVIIMSPGFEQCLEIQDYPNLVDEDDAKKRSSVDA